MEDFGMRRIYGICFILFAMLLIAAPSKAQYKRITGRVLEKQFGNNKPKPFEEEVRVLGYNTVSAAKKDKAMIDKNSTFMLDADAETVADENGYYSIDIAPTGALIVIVGTTNELREIKKRLEHNFVIEGGIALKNTVVTAKAKVATVDSMEVIDTGSTIECSSILTIPENIGRDFARCVFQPFVIDCQTGDTIEYRQPRVYDGKDYALTQDRRMFYDMNNDILKPYIQSDPLTSGLLQIRWSDSIKKRNLKHSYTCMAGLMVADYNNVYYKDEKQVSSCLARRPFQFLEFSTGWFELDPMQYKENPRAELRDGAENISLSFVVGKAELDPNPENAEELDRLNKKLQDIDQSGDYQLKRIALTGYASPDGLYDKNYKLAQQRSELAKSLISRNFKREIFIYSNKPVVVGWNVVVDSLKAKGLTEEAETVDAIIKANKIIDRQTAQIQKLKFYATAIAPILPKLRIFKCEYAYQTTRALEPEQILDNYLHNPDFQEGGKKMLSHYDYWHLFNMITDPVESEKLYKRAFYESKKNEARPWVYAANKLVVSYLKRDTMDLEVLRPFVDINVPHVNVERRTFAGHKYYVNIDRVVANQITEYYKAEHNDTAYYLAKMLPDVEEFREIRSFSIVKGTMFKKNKTPEQKEELAKAIEVVQNSSPINKAVIQIAQNRNKEAAETVASLNDEDPRKWYMKAVLDSRDMDFVAGATDLDHCFQLDKKYIVIMENDGDISDDVKEMWQDMYGSAMSE